MNASLARLIFALVLLTAGAAPARLRVERKPPSVLATDPRLRKPITRRDRFLTLQEALVAIGKATGISLRAERQLADEDVILLVHNKPAGEVLEALAETLGYRWRALSRDRALPAYEIYQDDAARADETRLRRKRRELGMRALEKQLRDRLARAHGLPAEATQPFDP